ncbi:MAG: hypothetical protein ACHQZR_06875 [Candidatus Limnocylindrales bacterium]
MERTDRDTLLAVVSGVAVGLLALSFPSPIAFLGLIPGAIAALDLARRRQLTSVGVLLISAALTAGLPSAWTLFGPDRVSGAGLPAATAAVFGVACGTFILGVMVLLIEPDADAAAAPARPVEPAGPATGAGAEPAAESSAAPGATVTPATADTPVVEDAPPS